MARQTLYATTVEEVNRGIGLAITGYKSYMKRNEGLTKDLCLKSAELILEEAKIRAPYQTGALRASGKAYLARSNPGNFVATVSFGGETSVIGRNSRDGVVRYALIVHEDLAGTVKSGEPKYLENAGNALKPAIKQMFIDAFRAQKYE